MEKSAMRQRRFVVFLCGIAAMTVMGCSPHKAMVRSPKYELNTVEPSLSADQVAQAVRQGAVAAGWSIVSEKPGMVLVRASEGGHHATVSVRYDDNGYVISHESSSEGLKYDGETIHRRYNYWVERLDRFLKQEMLEEYEQAAQKRTVEEMMPLPEEDVAREKESGVKGEDLSAQASPEAE